MRVAIDNQKQLGAQLSGLDSSELTELCSKDKVFHVCKLKIDFFSVKRN